MFWYTIYTFMYYWVPALVLLPLLVDFVKRSSPLDKLPIYGIPKGPFGRIVAAYKCFTSAKQMIEEGYKMNVALKGGAFRIPNLFRGYIVMLPSELIPEIMNQPEDAMSKAEAENDRLATYVMLLNKQIFTDPYHIDAIKTQLGGGAASYIEGLEEELVTAFEAEVAALEARQVKGAYVSFSSDTVDRLVARAINRLFLGEIMCKDEKYIKTMRAVVKNISLMGSWLAFFPTWARPALAPLATNSLKGSIDELLVILGPVIEERFKMHQQNTLARSNNDKIVEPIDILQSIIQQAWKREDDSALNVVLRLIALNLSTLQPTSIAVQNLLLNLATRPGGMNNTDPLFFSRELTSEVNFVFRHYVTPELSARNITQACLARSERLKVRPESIGWSLRTLNHLTGFDSFIRETLRLDVAPTVALHRKVSDKSGITLKNGLYLPYDSNIAFAADAIHRHESGPDSAIFEGFRTAPPAHHLPSPSHTQSLIQSGIEPSPPPMATLTRDNTIRPIYQANHPFVEGNGAKYITFDAGASADPARFFKVNLLKLVGKHLLLNYEVKDYSGGRKENEGRWLMMLPPRGGAGDTWFKRRE